MPNLWDIVRDGLMPIRHAIKTVANPQYDRFCSWLMGDHSIQSMGDRLADAFTAGCGRRERVRTWLHMDGKPEVAKELDRRLGEVIGRVRKWEELARLEALNRARTWKSREESGAFVEIVDVIGERCCEKFNEISDEAAWLAQYIKDLETSIDQRPDRQGPSLDWHVRYRIRPKVERLFPNLLPEDVDREVLRLTNEYIDSRTRSSGDASSKSRKENRKKPGRTIPPEELELREECYNAWMKYCEYCSKQVPPRRPLVNQEFEEWLLDSDFAIGTLTAKEVQQKYDRHKLYLKRNSADKSLR